MPATINTLDTAAQLLVLGESIRPLMTNAMGSSIEVCDIGEVPPTPARRPTATRGKRSTS